MVFILRSQRMAASPNGFLFVHRVMRFLISGLRYKVQGSGFRVQGYPQITQIFADYKDKLATDTHGPGVAFSFRLRHDFAETRCRAKHTQKIIRGSRLINNGAGVPLSGLGGIYGLPIY
jgi:hypothetical protein